MLYQAKELQSKEGRLIYEFHNIVSSFVDGVKKMFMNVLIAEFGTIVHIHSMEPISYSLRSLIYDILAC